jgi:hypothetical protein
MTSPLLGQNLPILGQEASQLTPMDGPQIRLLICRVCNTIEELPDYEGAPENDSLLAISVERHKFPSGQEHIGTMMKVPLSAWAREDVRKEIIHKIKGGDAKGLAAIDPKYYETRSIFADDAMTCFKAHLRPSGGCPDYGSDAKALRPDTKAERKELGLAPISKSAPPTTYLCQFCPVHTHVATQKRAKAGLYS